MRTRLPTIEPLTARRGAKLEQIARIANAMLVDFGPGAPLRQVQVLLAVRDLQPASRNDIHAAVEANLKTVLTDLKKLSETDRFGKRGRGMISARWDDSVPRRIVYSLTPHGHEVLGRFARAVDTTAQTEAPGAA